MDEIKRCVCCGKVISSIHDIGFNKYRHIRIKYCDTCRETIDTLRNRGYQYDFKQRKKVANNLRDKRQSLLEQENELMREMNLQLKDRIEYLERYIRSGRR